MAYCSRYLRITDPFMEGIDVRNIQEQLKRLSYYNGDATGIYDKDTAEAVQKFQSDNGLINDGIVGPDTWNAIGLSPESLEYFDSKYSIEIDLLQKELVLKEGQKILKTYSIAVGKPTTPTPTGNWRIIQKTVNPGGPFGARWMKLSVPWGGYGIHGTNEPTSIGKAASHGCIRMRNEDVIKLYDIVPLGTEVKIMGDNSTGRLLYIGVDQGADIGRVQNILNKLGYYYVSINGIYDTETRDSVMEFQKDYGLLPDGVVGTNTYQSLNKLEDTLNKSTEP